MNLVTAVIVESAIKTGKEDAEMMRHQVRSRLGHIIPHIQRIFSELDKSKDGSIQQAELDFSHINLPDDLKQILQPDKLMDLFQLLDVDNDGQIEADEFVDGVCQLALSTVPTE